MSVGAVAEPAAAIVAAVGVGWPVARRGGRVRAQEGERVVLVGPAEPGEPEVGSRGSIYLVLDGERAVVLFDDGTGGVFPLARLRHRRAVRPTPGD